MRLDLYLKRSRLIPRRTLAQQACEAGSVSVNGQVSKGSKAVKVGDLIQWRRRNQAVTLRVTRLPGPASGKAPRLFEVVEIGRGGRPGERGHSGRGPGNHGRRGIAVPPSADPSVDSSTR